MTMRHIRVIDHQQLHGMSPTIQTAKVNLKVKILSGTAAINTQLRASSNGARAWMQTAPCGRQHLIPTVRVAMPHRECQA